MKKRVNITALLLVIALLLSGCSSMFDTEYRSEEPYEDEYFEIKDDSSVQEVKNYQNMKNALMNLINSAAEYGIIRTEKYKGNAEDDISKACFEVTRENPMGIYAVDYITHSVNRIVSYYEIELYITYKRSAEEIAGVVTIHSGKDMHELLDEALENFDGVVAVMQVSTAIGSEDILDYVENFYRKSPQLLPVKPRVVVNTYGATESSVQEITEVKLTYPLDAEEMERRQGELRRYSNSVFDINSYGDAVYVCRTVMERCTPTRSSGGNTAYDALVGSGEVDAEGYAMAVKLLCNSMGIKCYVVEGRMDGERHFWNIVNLGEENYHVDVFTDDVAVGDVRMLSDDEMDEHYTWDTEMYPACSKVFGESEANTEE